MENHLVPHVQDEDRDFARALLDEAPEKVAAIANILRLIHKDPNLDDVAQRLVSLPSEDLRLVVRGLESMACPK